MTQINPDAELIDATQMAVFDAASDVVGWWDKLVDAVKANPFYFEAEFWVAVAFVLVVVALAKPVVKKKKKMFKQRSDMIAERINEAVELKEDAQRLLAEYERKFRSAEKEANDILLKSEREIEVLKRDTLAKLDAEMKVKEKEIESRLRMAEVSASREIADNTADLTIDVVKKILATSLDDKALAKLIDNSIDNLKKSA